MIGKITKINNYKNGTGCFIGIDKQPKDFMYFGSPNVKIGDEVEYEIGKPTSTGNPTIKTIKRHVVESFVDIQKPDSKIATKDEIITRLACIKAASQFIIIDGNACKTDDVIKLAKRFEDYARTGN